MRITPEPIEKREILFAVMISLALLLIDISTVSLYPTVWCDEVSFGEPAINFAREGRFVTSVWPAQPAGTFWTANTPMYPLVLSGWIHCFGQSLLALRSLNYVLISLACLGIWFLACRFQLSRDRTSRLLLIPLIHLGYGVSFAYRCNRPDILGLIILVLYVASFRLSHTWIRSILVATCGIAAVWTGPQLGIIIGIGAIVAWFLRWVQFKDVIATAIGGILGVISFFSLLQINHAIPDFMASVALGRTGGTGITHSPLTKVWGSMTSYVGDYSLIPLLVVSAYLTFSGWKFFSKRVRQQASFLWFGIMIVPALLNTTSNYGYYYSYLVYIPACLIVLLASDRIHQAKSAAQWQPRYLFLAAALAAITAGMPTRIWIALRHINLSSRTAITEEMRHLIRHDDVAVVENAIFFEAKSITPRVFGEFYCRFGKITDSEKSSVNVLVIYPKDLNRYASQMGGTWEPQGQPFGDNRIARPDPASPILKRLLERHFSTPQMTRAPLQVYRRDAPSPL